MTTTASAKTSLKNEENSQMQHNNGNAEQQQIDSQSLYSGSDMLLAQTVHNRGVPVPARSVQPVHSWHPP